MEKEIKTLEDLKEFVRQIPENQFDQNICNIDEPKEKPYGCILYHLHLHNQINLKEADNVKLAIKFQISPQETSYLFNLPYTIRKIAGALKVKEPNSFKVKDAIQRIEIVQKLREERMKDITGEK